MSEPRAPKRLFIETYGCQMNVYDSERMRDVLGPLGYTVAEKPDDADLVILNTCHIREKATEKVYSEIGRLRAHKERRAAEGKGMTITIAGCVAQAEGEEIIRRAPEVDLVVGPQAYHKLPELIARVARKSGEQLATDFTAQEKFDRLPARAPDGVTAFLSIQEGCDKFCTFCVVPYTRGAEFSRPIADVLAEARALADKGVREITLLGQNVNAYHGGAAFTDLLSALAEIDTIARIRYMTSHPIETTDELIAMHGSEVKLMPYLHLPVQSGSDRILKAMNRKHDGAFYRDIISRVRAVRPDIALSTDFIVGFPGETEKEFEATMQLVNDLHFAAAFSFKYSSRPGTPAAAMVGQVSEDDKSRRLAVLQKRLFEQQTQFNASQVGRTLSVLVTGTGRRSGQKHGRSPYLQSVHFDDARARNGDIVEVHVTGSSQNSLSGEVSSLVRA
ncbi:tRNA (N6-isopentenyl adenosine(37)-C2)-methylthiotransferase MiaB [Candidatus Viadribacter manganicus]|uniref:tRNA-2-methylthio-N(6)-dimethylallyladenosine synthase n=1 Tax=Candidatus Viadribacter manganicus TaxID=1759059 RepID=A0A1B1AI54_9PROT|nr:tRNA (N6-isopentenyl adenosine(37)-C2)-methylthiotransferase MiaB [Candidatus Viadribacter manganicus]ANP46238.1 tRNA-2-methylthio-N(6)-dimethylallyladenosine synthase MiaB [Candidatus Viadribacter manganicus]